MSAARLVSAHAAAGTGAYEKFRLVIRNVEYNSALRRVEEDDGMMVFLDRRADRIGPQLRRERGYKYISLSGVARRQDFQHGIAALVSTTGFAIFDPNFGEFQSTTAAEFDADLVEILDRAYELFITNAYYVTFRRLG